MAYTPELNYEASCTLRRIAWANGKPMTKTINELFLSLIPKLFDSKKICKKCKYQMCDDCLFNKEKDKNDFPNRNKTGL